MKGKALFSVSLASCADAQLVRIKALSEQMGHCSPARGGVKAQSTALTPALSLRYSETHPTFGLHTS